MLELEVVPERSLGCEQWEFILGMHFSQSVAIIQSQVGIIRGVQVLYSDTVFVLNFRGLSFYFPIDSKFQPGYAHGLGSLRFSNGASPLVAKTAIYVGNNVATGTAGGGEEHSPKTSPPPLPLVCYHNNLYLDKAEVIRDKVRTRGLKLHLFTEGGSATRVLLEPKKHRFTKEVWFGDSCEDVLSALGAPSRVFFKAEDKMRIHSPHAHKRDKTRRSDFFYNYFTLGLDVLFDAKTQWVKKFVLHTNYPGHYNFNMYHRCEFTLNLPPETIGASDSGKLIDVSPSPVTITAYTKWDRVSEQLKASARPVVLNRASSTNTTNPFGCTFCYGVRDVIVEVMANQHIASVTLYETA
ncbi:PHAF1 protein CG7083 isoform X3 [Neodiprion pinetum]|uniref:PHAF1 protein CG7083 isoform X3 n=1 Tax=Neodiprion pinetum TaxID=441929 RepID=UPI00371669BC